MIRFLEAANVSGPYSAFRALSPFARPQARAGLSHQRPNTQAAASRQQGTDRVGFHGPDPLNEKQEV